MKVLTFSFILFFCLFSNAIFAQTNSKQNATQNIVWYGYYLTLEFSPKWRLVSEVQERHFIDPFAHQLWLARTRLYRSLGHNWDAGLGYTTFWNNPNTPCTENCLTIPELRPYQEFQYRQTLGKGWSLRHRYIIEERFFRKTENGKLAKGYDFNWRFRYQIGADYDLFKLKKTEQRVRLRFFDEVMVNAGTRIVSNMFDQNRLYAGFLIPFTKKMSFELGYMHWYQQRSSGNQYFNRHILRLGINHQINL